MHITDRAVPLDSIIVVVGANGFIGADTCEKVLQAGLRCRGTVRDAERDRAWMHALFDKQWPGKFELVQVADFEAEGAFDQAFEGAAGVIFPSMPTILDLDPAKVIGPMTKGVINSLESASRSGVKRYVLSSSSKAVSALSFDEPVELTAGTYNHAAIDASLEESKEASFQRIVDIYSSGRTLSELAMWDWVKENNPPFIANSVVPDGQFGRVLDTQNIGVGDKSSTGQLTNALQGQWDKIGFSLAFVTDVQDLARLMVAAVAVAPIQNERIFSYYINRTWNDMRHKVREMFPGRPELVQGEDSPTQLKDLCYAPGPIARAEQILRDIGQPGFTSEEDILKAYVASMFP